ncbi:uncharacterized protein LOC119650422 [Hermetia illucens]|uniref:uncharacterized protein LOC119650422 n=1 Tax=Hermetia illucens TaxID=343691 RepID=UPI0018CC6663|nr:uncharacterized protein LOC119650422 [Hermetia illucens]
MKKQFPSKAEAEGKREVKKKCEPHHSYKDCVHLRHTQNQIRDHAIAREKIIAIQEKLQPRTCYVEIEEKKSPDKYDLIKFASPTNIGNVKLASPSPSLDYVNVPSRRLLDLKNSRSGVFINETPFQAVPPLFEGYNPRLMQESLEKEYQIFDIAQNAGQNLLNIPGRKVDAPKRACCCHFAVQKRPMLRQLKDVFTKDRFLHMNVNIEEELDVGYLNEATNLFLMTNTNNILRDDTPKSVPLREKKGSYSYQFRHEHIKLNFFSEFRCERKPVEELGRRPVEIALLFSAYAHTFVRPVYEWNMSTLLQIEQQGRKLFDRSVKVDYKCENSDFDIDRYLVLGKTPMTIHCDKPMFVGTVDGPGMDLSEVLKNYFSDRTACIFVCENEFYLIWKQCKYYYIFDPHGRDRESLQPNEKQGYATLIRCRTLQDVLNLLKRGSNLKPNLTFRLYDIQLEDYSMPHDVKTAKAQRPKRNYSVVNKYYAIIRASDGLPVNPKAKLNPSMLISCLARIYSDVDPARFWTQNLIDQLRNYSATIFAKQVKSEKLKTYSIANLSSTHRIGSYRTEINITPYFAAGQVGQCPTFRESQLVSALCLLFENANAGLLQIENYTMAVWKDSKFLYAFDPFRRSPAGMFIEREQKGAACLQIFLSLRTLCSVLYNNARAMAPQGNFFIHAIEMVKTRVAHHSKLKSEKATFPLLLLDCPVKCEEPIKDASSTFDAKDVVSNSDFYTRCLSVLSVSPCERTCSESEFIEKERKEKLKLQKMSNIKTRIAVSAVSLTESQKIDWFDSYDVVLPIIEDLLQMCYSEPPPPPVKENLTGKARKVLLKSDTDYLNTLIRNVERGADYDNFFVEFPTSPNIDDYITSLEEELKAETPFKLMPDGNWVVTTSNYFTLTPENMDLGGLAAFVAAVLASRYNVKFWNSQLLDYTIQTAMSLQSSTQIPKSFVNFLMNSKLPNIDIGNNVYNVSAERLAMGPAYNLQNMLEKAFENHNDIIVLFNTFSCAIFKRNVFYFLYIGLPCDLMGFRRKNTGAPTLVRSLDLDGMVRRIQANRNNTNEEQKGIVFGIRTRELTRPYSRFMQTSPSEEDLIYQDEKTKLDKKRERTQTKILFLKDELVKEKHRIDTFRREKYGEEDDFSDILGEEEYYEFEDDNLPKSKQVPGAELPPTDPLYLVSAEHERRQPELGFRYYQPDYNFKIQGTTALESRSAATGTHLIRPCHFAALYAILYVIHRPLKKWDFRRVDMVIENALELNNLIQDKNICYSRKINNVVVDNYAYGVEIKKYEIFLPQRRTPIDAAVRQIIEKRKYFMIQFENATYAIYKDQYFHLFDPYSTLEVINNSRSPNRPQRLKKIKPSMDRNTASWVIFPDIDYMLTYIEERVTSPNWRSEFNLYVVNILSTRRAPKKKRFIHVLATSPIDPEVDEPEYQIVELQTEKVAWIEMFGGVIPWSPLTPMNMNNDKRGFPHTKWKSFDIELPGTLYTLWGDLHPKASVFGNSRDKQYQATNVIACCMAYVYHVEEWTPNILDAIVVNGDKYFRESTTDIVFKDYEMSLEDLNVEFSMGDLCNFAIHLESVVFGLLYESKPKMFNLSRALSYFFVNNRYGVIQCMRKTLGFGKTKTGYFLFDCQSHGAPLFQPNQGCAYTILTNTLETLLYCLTVTLQIPYYNIEFLIHAVRPGVKKPEGDSKADVGKFTPQQMQQTDKNQTAENAGPATAVDPAAAPPAPPPADPAPEREPDPEPEPVEPPSAPVDEGAAEPEA